MGAFFLCFLQIILYSLGAIVLGGLLVELCYRLCFLLLSRRAGRAVWRVSGLIGTPVHELGHALMCFLFFHRIERIRLWSTPAGGAMVQHSYNRRNLYAKSGNLWISLGPIFSGLAVMLLTLYLVYPATLAWAYAEVKTLLEGERELLPGLAGCVWQMVRGLWQESTRAIGWRILALLILFSTALHVRLSTADLLGMLSGLPGYFLICALSAGIAAALGRTAQVGRAMQTFGGVVAGMFGLILLFALLQLMLSLLFFGVSLLLGRRTA